jgi:hypothetical protein
MLSPSGMHVAVLLHQSAKPLHHRRGKDNKMKAELPNPLLHNPFHNRFNDPVSQRRDELSEGYMLWLRERNLEHSGYKIPSIQASTAKHVRGVVPGAFALLLLIAVSMVFLVRM